MKSERPSFETGTAFLLARAGSQARRHWNEMLSERGLSPHQYGVLMVMGTLDQPSSQQRLSDLIGIDSRNAVPIVDALVNRGLISREVDQTDRRRRRLALTEDGRAAVVDLVTVGAEIEDRFFQVIPSTDREELRRILITLTAVRPGAGD